MESNDSYVCHDVDNVNQSPANGSLATTGSYFLIPVMKLQEKQPLETLQHVCHIFWTILPTLCCFAIARLLVQKLRLDIDGSTRRFLLEFLVICVPIVLCVNVANYLVPYFLGALFLGLLLLLKRSNCLSLAQSRRFDLGRHTRVLTLVRATINILTVVCILAIDFESFPKVFRKTRRYGAGLMDVGIGLFIFAMGSVSRRPRRSSDLIKLLKMVAPVLLLGLARTVVITCIGYAQDEHEYGRHLNAFFTLGLTKLFGTLLSGIANNDVQLVPMGLGLLAAHESMLLLGVSDYVMDKDLKRNTFLTANREGICSLPGCMAIYLVSMYIGQWLQSHESLSYKEFMQKLKTLSLMAAGLWLLVLLCIFSVGIARVTSNFGYGVWILAIATTMTALYMFVFDLVFNTVWPVTASTVAVPEMDMAEGALLQKPLVERDNSQRLLPTLVEAINRNGLTYFLLANVLTGGVNIFLKPGERTDAEGICILCGYMFIATGFVYILYRFKIRIA